MPTGVRLNWLNNSSTRFHCFNRRLPHLQFGENFAEAVEGGFEVFDDLFSEVVWFGQVVQVDQAVVLEPEDIETGLVARP